MRWAGVLLILASSASPAWAGGLTGGAAPSIPWMRMFLAFAFCIALAWLAVVVLRHYQRRGIANPLRDLLARQGAAPRRIAIIETRRASIHADLCLVECDEETYFLVLTASGATILKRDGSREPAE